MIDHLRSCNSHAPASSLRPSPSPILTSASMSPSSTSKPIDTYFNRPSAFKIPDASCRDIRAKQTFMVASAQLPFRFVENEEFVTLCQALINIGASSGRVDAKKLLVGRKATRSDMLQKQLEVKQAIKTALSSPCIDEAVSFVTDLWTDNIVMRSYLDITFFWVDVRGDDSSQWTLKRGMFACKFFPAQKTAENIEAVLDEVLLEAGVDLHTTPVTTDKGSNIVAATQQHTRIDCACHRLSTAISKAWETTKTNCQDLSTLDENVNHLIRFVKKSSNIQHQLPCTLKTGGTTRPWRSLMQKFQSVSTSYTALQPILSERGRLHLVEDLNQPLLEEVKNLLSIAQSVFNLLEFASSPALQSVLPAFFLLRNTWSAVAPTDSATIRILRKNLVKELDAKWWPSISAIHVAATWLDPTLKHLLFVEKEDQKLSLLKQARDSVSEYGLRAICRQRNRAGEVIEIHHPRPPPQKIARFDSSDPLASYRNCGKSQPVGTPFSAEENMKQRLREEMDQYSALEGIPSDGVFDPLQWWGVSKFRFPLLSTLAKTILVIQASSSESERHFSGAGKVARKERNRLKPDAVEAQVLVHQGLKQGLIS